MVRTDNYQIQAQQAKSRFLTYDQQDLIDKLRLRHDENYLYIPMLGNNYRISRANGDMQRCKGDIWLDANSHGEVMTLLDLLCDSRKDRYVSGRWKNMTSFGMMFHQNLLETGRDPWAEKFENNVQGFCKACRALGGIPFEQGDAAFAIELFDGLPIVIQLWLGDEEFPPNLRLLWDENALMYIRYETMYFVRGMLLQRLEENM